MSTWELMKKLMGIIAEDINNIDIKYLQNLHIICTKKSITNYDNNLLCYYPILDDKYDTYISEFQQLILSLKNDLLNNNIDINDIKHIIKINYDGTNEIKLLYTLLQVLKEYINIINLLQ